ncbi:MAG: hypothetical protein V3S64_09120 [bacterium]
MNPDRTIGELDPSVLEYFKFGAFSWWQLVIFFAAIAALAGYFFIGVLLNNMSNRRAKWAKQRSQVERWLEAWELDDAELEHLRLLAGELEPRSLYGFLGDPVRFEERIHEHWLAGRYFPVSERLRGQLGYYTDNLRGIVVSTRQLMPGDHFRFSTQAAGAKPRHFYGQMVSGGREGIVVEVSEGGCDFIRAHETESELFYLRGDDLEYRFPLKILGGDPQREHLVLAHQLVDFGHRPRAIRLPLVRPMEFSVRALPSDDRAEDEQPGQIAGAKVNGVLLELSEGGFSALVTRTFPAGVYFGFSLTLPRGRVLPILGRMIESRPFGGKSHIIRCEARGMSRERRNTLDRLLRTELNRRLSLEKEKKRSARQKADSGGRGPGSG